MTATGDRAAYDCGRTGRPGIEHPRIGSTRRHHCCREAATPPMDCT